MANFSDRGVKTDAVARQSLRLFVVGLDIGTAYSGWAYSQTHDPNTIFTNTVWHSQDGYLSSMKTSTCVLLTPEKNFEAFGYEAETKYTTMAEDKTHLGWYLFRGFKMKLYETKNLSKETIVEDISGKQLPLITVFSHTIKYLTDHCMDVLRTRIPDVTSADVLFVLTVPAIWPDRAKRLMREAAQKCGIDDDQLVFALEPEAASIWCQHLKTEINRNLTSLDISGPGTQYMIVDIGGGTADITVHEKRKDGSLKELHKVSGGPWGGNNVNTAILKLIGEIVGTDVMEKFTHTELADALHLERTCEQKKRTINTKSSDKITIRLPFSLMVKKSVNSVSEAVERYGEKLEFQGDKIRVNPCLFQKCFEKPLSDILTHVDSILSEQKMSKVGTIMLVGGQAESTYIQTSFKRKFKNKTVIVPPDCGLAVVKGAVLFGHSPEAISFRVARHTYGVEIAAIFDSKKHDAGKKVFTNAGLVCKDLFWKIVTVNDDVPRDHVITREGKAVNDRQKKIRRKLYRTDLENPKYTTDPGCIYVGEFCFPLDETLRYDENTIQEKYCFGGTEIACESEHNKTGKKYSCRLSLN